MSDDGPDLAQAFLGSIASKDRVRLTSLLADDVDFL